MKIMKLKLYPIAFAGALLVTAAGSYAVVATPAYKISREVALGAPDKWDFLTFDGSSERIFVSHATEVDVVDAGSGAIVGRIPGFNTSHGIVTVPALGRGYADSGNTKSVIVFDLKTLKPLATLTAGEDADAMTYDPATKRVFVMDADGAAFTAIDAVKNQTISTVPLGGKPEAAVSDGTGTIYINLASTNEVVKLDAATLAIKARWPVAACESPHGLAMDTDTHRLFLSCKNDKLIVVSSDDGRVVADVPIGHGTDAADFDPKRKLIFSSNGDGTLSVIAERGADRFEKLADVPTRPGARTMALDTQTGRIFVMTGDAEPSQVTARGARPNFVPGSLKLIWLEPAIAAQ
jgi:DNA-binding beta-propeller fold protein YncE